MLMIQVSHMNETTHNQISAGKEHGLSNSIQMFQLTDTSIRGWQTTCQINVSGIPFFPFLLPIKKNT